VHAADVISAGLQERAVAGGAGVREADFGLRLEGG